MAKVRTKMYHIYIDMHSVLWGVGATQKLFPDSLNYEPIFHSKESSVLDRTYHSAFKSFPGSIDIRRRSWRRHQMETFSAFLALRARNSPVTGEFPAQRPVTRNFDVFFNAWTNGWINNRYAGDLRRHHAHYDGNVCYFTFHCEQYIC